MSDSYTAMERQVFAAKLRIARAVLGWTQSELGRHIHLTQRSIHRLENGHSEPKYATVLAFDRFCRDFGILFRERSDGGIELAVNGSVLAITEHEQSQPTLPMPAISQ